MDAENLMAQAQNELSKSNYAGAAVTLKAALKLAVKDVRLHNQCLMSLADTQRMAGDFRAAARYYEKADKAALVSSDESSSLDAKLGRALSRRALGFWPEALNVITEVNARYIELNDSAGAAFGTWALAGTLRIKGDINGAIEAFTEAQAMFADIGDTSGTGYCQCGLGGAYRMKGLYDKSLGCYTNAGDIFASIKDRFGTAYSHCGIGNALRMTGRYADGLGHLDKALDLYARIGDVVSSAYTLWSIGMLKLMISEAVSGEHYFKAAAARFKKTLDVRGLVYADLGACQVRYLYRHIGPYKPPLRRAINNAAVYGFRLEGCHADKLLSVMEGGDTDCYESLGITELHGKAIPLNIP